MRASAWYRANKERANAASRAWGEKNKELARIRATQWRRANLERARLNDANKKKKRTPEEREYWRAKNRLYEHKRRARKAQTEGALSTDLGETLFAKQRGMCAACRCDISKKYELDHIIPLAIGGLNCDSNIQLLCRFCNRSKGKKHPVEFMQERGMLL